jgi:hypothetical protein
MFLASRFDREAEREDELIAAGQFGSSVAIRDGHQDVIRLDRNLTQSPPAVAAVPRRRGRSIVGQAKTGTRRRYSISGAMGKQSLPGGRSEQ